MIRAGGNFNGVHHNMDMAVKQRYVRSLLGQRPFPVSFNILHDITITISTLTVESVLTLRTLESTVADNTDKLCTLRALWHIDGVVGWDVLDRLVKDLHANPEKYEYLYPTLSSEMTEILWKLYQEFVATLDELRREVANKDFWQGAG